MSLSNRIGRAIFWGQAGRLAETGFYFFFYLHLARALGPSDYGRFALGLGLAGACGFLAMLGLGPETLGRFLPEISSVSGQSGVRKSLGMLLCVRFMAIAAVAGVAFAFRSAIAARLHFPVAAAAFALVLAVFAARSLLDLATYFSAGLLELRRVAAAKLAAAVLTPGAFLSLAIWSGASVRAAWLATAAGSCAGLAILLFPFLRVSRPTAVQAPGARAVPFGRILAFGMFAWATNIFLYVLGDNTDVLLLGWLVGNPATVGAYAAASKIAFSLTGLLSGWIALASVATLSETLQKGGVTRLAKVTEAQWKLGALCLIPPLLFLVRFAREILSVLYSPAYASGAAILQILAGLLAVGVVFGFSIPGGVLYVLDRERLACAAVGIAAAFNLVSEIFLVRRLGAAGAAWATGLSFVLVAALCAAASAACIPLRFPAAFLGRVVSGAAIAIGSTFWLHPGSAATLAAAAGLAAAVFVICLALLKPLRAEEAEGLRRVNEVAGVWVERLFAPARVAAKG